MSEDQKFPIGTRVRVAAHGPDPETPEFTGYVYPSESGQLRAWAVVRDESQPTCMHPEFWTIFDPSKADCKTCEDTGIIKIRNPLGKFLCQFPCECDRGKANR